MGGQGSGRPPSVETIIQRGKAPETPIGTGIYLPNYSGLQAVKKTDAAVGTGSVTSVFTRTGAVVAATNDYTWAQVDKTTSSIADITTKSHTALSDIGTETHAQIDTHVTGTGSPHTAAGVGAAAASHTHALAAGATDITATATEVNYIDGVTSAIQTQIDGKQAGHANLTSLAALAYSSASFVKMTAANSFVLDTGSYEPTLTKGNLTATSPISLDQTRQVIGGAAVVSIADAAADGSTKGAAAFNSTNFSAAAGVINTIQNIATTSTPQFARLGLGTAASATIPLNVSNNSSNNIIYINAGASSNLPNLQIDSAAGRPIYINKTGGGETILYLIQNDTYDPKFIQCWGGGETPILMEVLGTGNIWTVGDCSALTFTDRTPYPATLQEAYDAIASIEGINGKVSHEKLHSFVKSVQQKTKYNEITKQNENIGSETGRNLSATVSAQNEVIKDLIKRIRILENRNI